MSDVLEEELTAYGVVTRIKGSTRYETSVVIGETFFSNAEKAVLAYSDDYPDGLCAGPLAHALNAPILLTKEGKESAAGTYCSAHSIHSGYIVGGDARIPDASARDIFYVSEDTPVTKK